LAKKVGTKKDTVPLVCPNLLCTKPLVDGGRGVEGLPGMEKYGRGYVLVAAVSVHYLLHIANKFINRNHTYKYSLMQKQ